MNITDIVNNWGKLAGSVSAVIAAALIFIKPVKSLVKRRAQAKKNAAAAEQAERDARREFEKRVLAALETITDDVAELQRDRLCQAHEYYMRQGWCTPAKKRELCAWHAAYTKKGRNHLTEHYEEDIMDLPEFPKTEQKVYS